MLLPPPPREYWYLAFDNGVEGRKEGSVDLTSTKTSDGRCTTSSKGNWKLGRPSGRTNAESADPGSTIRIMTNNSGFLAKKVRIGFFCHNLPTMKPHPPLSNLGSD